MNCKNFLPFVILIFYYPNGEQFFQNITVLQFTVLQQRLDKNVLAILDLTPRGTGFMGAGNEGPSNQENANDNDSESNRNLQI